MVNHREDGVGVGLHGCHKLNSSRCRAIRDLLVEPMETLQGIEVFLKDAPLVEMNSEVTLGHFIDDLSAMM